MKIWLIGSITPVNDVAGPLIIYRHFKYFEENGHQLKVITHQYAGYQEGEKWETIKLSHTKAIKFFRRIFFRKHLRWIGEEIVSYLLYLKAKNEFKIDHPDVILTTWSDYLLPCAYRLSKKHKIPLVIFCHDDLENQISSDFINNFIKRKRLKQFYQFANARLCVATGMNEEFQKRYGVWGDVLYPIGGSIFTKASINNENAEKKITFGYFGSISNGALPLLFLADCLLELNAELHISSTGFPKDGPFTEHKAIKNIGFFKERRNLINYIDETIDVCMVAQSFDVTDKVFLETNFPSKLIDMMGFNLPILILAPEYGSSARLAKSYPEVFNYINKLDKELVKASVTILQNPTYRLEKSLKVTELYKKTFDPLIIHNQLETILTKIANNA
ncbi:glycosyltransferase [Pedobacter fastidiosus]|uniref:Glycosyltransferase n=1 Tax=Pedobacter fastidiosus TaxID=2765361 RepID=A0ABR7KVN1_9SPHI|nr:glycosyltransferase [Pedobacter fastidiosus]MBC6112173.1 glycosyltransferase [Pedobacter fastidiosus]